MDLRELELYLPKYLSPATEQNLFRDLSAFPENIDQRLYTTQLQDSYLIYQGDAISDLLVVELPSLNVKSSPCMILSSTCDVDPANQSDATPSNVVYSPIIKLKAYEKLLTSADVRTGASLQGHLEGIRRQRVTQIFYLPPCQNMPEEGIVFFDRLVSCPNRMIDRTTLRNSRIFTLSQYGHYLFLFKLSIHFTRVTEKVDRPYSGSSF